MKRFLALMFAAATVTACGEQDPVASLPVADAGFDHVIVVGQTAQLDGSGSFDPGGTTLTYTWQLESRPVGSDAAVVRAATAAPTLLADVAGQYLVKLAVSNGKRDSEPDRVGIRALSELPNAAPVADARCVPQPCTVPDCQAYGDCWVSHGGEGSLSARQSTDANNDPLTYLWEQVLPADCASECPALPANDCPTVTESVTPVASITDPAVWSYTASTELGKLVFKLTVNDNSLSGTDCVSIDSINFAPRAIVAQTPTSWNLTTNGSTFQLDGTPSADSDPPDPGNLTFSWSHLPSDVSVSYDPSASDPEPQVTITSVLTDPTDLTFVLTVNDGNAANNLSSCDVGSLADCSVNCCGLVVTLTP